jgi:hypothetical protein
MKHTKKTKNNNLILQKKTVKKLNTATLVKIQGGNKNPNNTANGNHGSTG